MSVNTILWGHCQALFECRLGCVCAAKPGIFPLWPLKKKHVATSSSSQRRKQAQRSLETCPGSHSYKEKSQDLNPGCLLLIHQCYCFWMVLAGPKIQWCSQPGGHGVTGGQGSQRGLAMAGVRGWIHSWTLICLPFLGNRGEVRAGGPSVAVEDDLGQCVFLVIFTWKFTKYKALILNWA